MKYLSRLFVSLALLAIPACDFTDFEATWRDPAAMPLQLGREHVAAVLLSGNESVRRSFEDNLANELNERGIETTPGYKLVSETDVTDKDKILTDLKGTRLNHAVFMRIVDRQLEPTYVPGSAWYPGFTYDPFFYYAGVYVGPGFGGVWPPFYDDGYYRLTGDETGVPFLFSIKATKPA